jgi:hypothetical protein
MDRLAMIFGAMTDEHKEEETTSDNLAQMGDRFITLPQLTAFVDVVMHLGWAFTEFAVVDHLRAVRTPLESPRRISGWYFLNWGGGEWNSPLKRCLLHFLAMQITNKTMQNYFSKRLEFKRSMTK